MDKSIERIWKEGFAKDESLIIPKLNNLYEQKSSHIIDKFKLMFRWNLILVLIGSFIILGSSFLVGIPYMGILMFIAMNVLVILNKRLLNSLIKIDKAQNSYDYLMAFDSWLKYQVKMNTRFSRFFYPFILFALVFGFWMKEEAGKTLGEHLVNKLLLSYPDLNLINGIPVVGILGLLVGMGLMALVAGRIYEWDLRLVYGRVFDKLEDIISDIRTLKESA